MNSTHWRNAALAAGLVSLLVAVMFTARPAYRHLKTWRSKGLLKEAQELVTAQKWEAAVEKGRAAYELNPEDPSTQRFMAGLLTRLRSEQALPFWENLVVGPWGTLEDRLGLVSFAIELRRFELAGRYVGEAVRTAGTNARPFVLAATINEQRGDVRNAARFAEMALERAPGDAGVKFLLGRQTLFSRDAGRRSRAKSLLWEVGGGTNTLALQALAFLAETAELTPEENRRCAAAIEAHPEKAPEKRLLLSELKLKAAPSARAAVLESTIREYPRTNGVAPHALGRWLNRQRAYSNTVEVIPPAVAVENREALMIHLDALAGMNAWGAIRDLLSKPKLPLEPTLVSLFLARSAHELGDARVANLHWEQAHSHAGSDRSMLWYVAEYGERLGREADAVKAYRKLVEEPRGARPAFMALLRLAERAGDTRQLRELMLEIQKRYPQDPEPKNDVAYLELLLKVAGTNTLAESMERFKAQPEALSLRTTLALALLRNNDGAAAGKLYEGMNLDWSMALPGWQAVRVAALAGSGQMEQARSAAKQIPLDRLKPEERALVQPLL